MLTKTNKTIESFLPVFCGFYNSIFEPSEDMVIEEPFTFDNYEFFYSDYRNEIARACVNGIEKQLTEYGIKGVKIKYQTINSPKEYNFYTDAIHVEYKLTLKAIASINEYLKKNKEAFDKYIVDHYTSRDGFMSSWSNNVDVWLTEYLTDAKDLRHCFGAVLQFIFENEDYTYNNLYEDYCTSINLEGSLVNGVGETNDYIENFANENYKRKDIESITTELVNYFDENWRDFFYRDINDTFLTPEYIKGIVYRIFNNIDKHTLSLF